MNRLLAALFVIVAAWAWFGTLGDRQLVRPDEGRYAEIAREMKVSGDYVTPTLNGLKYFEKPPLQYWMTAIAYHVFGETPGAARMWSALTSVLAILMTFVTVRRLADRQLGVLAAMIHASMLWVFAMGHFSALDAALAAFLHICVCCYLLAYEPRISRARKRALLVLAAVAAALAVLSKGLIGLLIPGAAIGLFILISQRWRLISDFPWVLGGLAFFAIAAPWFVIVSARNLEFAQFFFIHEHFARFAQSGHAREGAPWYFVQYVLLGALPWLGFAIALARRSWRARVNAAFRSELPIATFVLTWCIFIFVFFSISKSKLPSYVLPMFGALAIALAPIVRDGSAALFTRALSPFALLCAVLVIISIPAVTRVIINDDEERLPSILKMAGELHIAAWIMIAGLVAAYVWRKPQARTWASACVSITAMIGFALAINSHDHLSRSQSGYHLAKEFLEKIPMKRAEFAPQVPFYSVLTYDQTLPFYLGTTMILVDYRDEMDLGLNAKPERYVPTFGAFIQRWRAHTHAYAVVDLYILSRLPELDVPHRVVAQDLRRAIISRQ